MSWTKIMWPSTETAAGVEPEQKLRAASAGSVLAERLTTAASATPEASVSTMSPVAAASSISTARQTLAAYSPSPSPSRLVRSASAGSVSLARPITSHLSPTPKAGSAC
ncbi:hypothetical protein Caci_7035 [Catenulispora acidiphila DSM 44928]|uniref:Uncharacterized protein n=1 Tax=Catenulispora acidiphila (strain DSM 44928 / JCM 14897 / NBRC 102108 / NRRL B-24433 / ID139908) TaxID=479433 RepID=C7Q596_CATAD|nr:hypothetical protein Caci_7035 [Catenulispora acidiphila DSM 44928]